MGDHAAAPPFARPGKPVATWERTCPGRKDQAAAVRAALRSFLATCSYADDVLTLVSELVANAVCHSKSSRPTGQFTVRVQKFRGDHIYAEVEDGGSDWDGDLAKAIKCPHGLFLLRELSADCGTRPGEHGWITWFTTGPSGARHVDPAPPDIPAHPKRHPGPGSRRDRES